MHVKQVERRKQTLKRLLIYHQIKKWLIQVDTRTELTHSIVNCELFTKNSEKMSAEILANDLKSRLHLRTKTVGSERIQRAKDNNEDVAILSMFLPGSVGEVENRRFRCALTEDCFLGDYRQATPGNICRHKYASIPCQ